MVTIINKAIRDPNHVIKILRLHTGRFFGHRTYKKFIVLSRNRTGSNMLISMLNSHPSIYARYEIIRTLDGNSVPDVLNKIYSRYPRFVKAVGFKIFYYHPVDDESGTVWNKLREMEDLYIIHLKRRNILRTILSKEIAQMTEAWTKRYHRGTIVSGEKKVHLDENELLKAFKQTRYWETTYEHIFRSHPMIEIYYEDLLNNTNAEFQKITDLLDLKFCNARTTFQKQNPERMSELIINYQSIKKSFSNTEWSLFFED